MNISTPVKTRIVSNMNVIFDVNDVAIGEMINTDLAKSIVAMLNQNGQLKNQIKDNAIMHVREVKSARSDAIAAVCVELVTNHESKFHGGVEQIASILQLVNDKMEKPIYFANKGDSEVNMKADSIVDKAMKAIGAEDKDHANIRGVVERMVMAGYKLDEMCDPYWLS